MMGQYEVKLILAPDELKNAPRPQTLIYTQLMEADVPIKWKVGGPPPDRDATEKDITKGKVLLVQTGNEVKARW